MTERRQCQWRWGVLMRQAGAIRRFKDKLRLNKLDWKRFYEQFFPTSTCPQSDSGEPTEDPTEGQNEDISMHSEYFDVYGDENFALSCTQLPHLTQFEPGSSSAPMPNQALMLPPTYEQEFGTFAQQGDNVLPFEHIDDLSPMQENSYDDLMLLHPQMDLSRLSDQGVLNLAMYGQQDSRAQCDPRSPPLSVSEYTDSYSDWPVPDQSMQISNGSVQRRISMSQMSVATEENVDMKDTGDSYTLPLQREQYWWLEKTLFSDDLQEMASRSQPSWGWGVVVRIVCACRKLSRLLRSKQVQNEGHKISIRRRMGFGDGRRHRYKGVRQRNGKWVSEIRIGKTQEKVWLGSYNTEKEAALAFDAGRFHCSVKRCRSFNFCESPRLLEPELNLHELSINDRRKKIQKLAEDHARKHAEENLTENIRS